MSRKISPSKKDIELLHPALEEYIIEVLEFFDKYLDIEWEIYTKPHLNC